MDLLFLSGNSVCWVSPFSASDDGRRENRIIFRGGPYGADYTYATLREDRHGPPSIGRPDRPETA